ncbi:MAG: leucyl aminopeptidase [Candidatus Sungbacteria bacterium]|nr:leucyl aminopeptidase [Candidatus Sungbacteria bacterium]
MKITPVSHAQAARAKTIFIPLFKNESPSGDAVFMRLAPSVKKAVLEFARKEFRGDEGETKSVWFAAGAVRRVRLFGKGEKSKWNERKADILPRRFIRAAKADRTSEYAVSSGGDLAAFARNSLMAHFEYNHYKETPKGGWPEVKSIAVAVADTDRADAVRAIADGIAIGEEVNSARELANTPGSDMTPTHLAEAARLTAKRAGFRATILDEKAIARLGMGGVLGVARGSDEKPRFIILEYRKGAKDQKPLVLVGKGVTFDTGGINLKPEQYMYEMHMDMSGGAAVIHGVAAIARLKLPVNVVGLIPAVENMPSGSSYRPGDLLKSMSGKTIEVLNTDAEGRVILADALTYALRYKPGLIADFATLTGAAHVALGNYCSAVFTNRDALTDKLVAVGTSSGDYVWPLPLWDEYLHEIKGMFGDIANMAKNDRYGGAIHGAKFLEQFVEDAPFAHIDIAPRMTAVDSDILARGATGVGVRYIAELAREYPHMETSNKRQETRLSKKS